MFHNHYQFLILIAGIISKDLSAFVLNEIFPGKWDLCNMNTSKTNAPKLVKGFNGIRFIQMTRVYENLFGGV